jgi:ATP-dependent protease ClpP protease subunit
MDEKNSDAAYAKITGLPITKVRALKTESATLDAKSAKNMGFIDDVKELVLPSGGLTATIG